MPRTYPEFDAARAVRRETLSLVEKLDQQQSEYQQSAKKWSVGQVLDHLVKLDTLVVRELEVTLNQRSRGIPLVYRGVADIDTSIPWALKPILPFFEIPFGVFNSAVPQTLRRRLTGNRRLSVPAPRVIEPRSGRRLTTLREELATAFRTLGEQQANHPQIDLNRVYYYNPIAGLNTVAGLYRFLSNHERRHQGQLRDLLADPSFPGPGEQTQAS